MSGGGGNFTSYLPVAAALAATVMTDGAAAPLLEETLAGTALEGAGATIAGGGIGALTGGATAAMTGQDVGRGALMGGLGGAALGYGGMYSGAPESLGSTGFFGSAGSSASPEYAEAMREMATAPTTTGGLSPYAQALGSNAQTTAGNLGTYWNAIGQPGAAPVLSNATNATLANATGVGAAGGAGAGILGTGITGTQAAMGLGGLGLAAAISQDNKRYGVPNTPPYTGGNLSSFSYNPATYRPDVVRPPSPVYQAHYAQGGPVNVDFMGGDMYPQSQIERSYYATPSQMPTSAQQTMASYEPKTNPLTGQPTANMRGGGDPKDALKDLMGSRDAMAKYHSQYSQNPSAVVSKAQDGDYNAMLALNEIRKTPNQNYAGGGIANLGGYSDGGRMLKGPGDGMSDSIPAKINGKQPARLADGEFVVPADVVSHIGNGSTDAGAKKLYSMMNKVRKARTGKQKQAPAINASKYVPA